MGIKISALPAIVTPDLTDIFPVVQGGVTYKETVQQLSTLIGASNVSSVTGTANQVTAAPMVGDVILTLPQDIAITSNVTFGSVAFSPTTKGIVGTPTNNNAGAGFVGEFISSTIVAGSAISITSAVATNLTSISLTAGDWDVWGNLTYLPANATNTDSVVGWISSTSATIPDKSIISSLVTGGIVTVPGGFYGINVPALRFSLPGTTTVYISGDCSFTVSTMTFCGGIYARRIR